MQVFVSDKNKLNPPFFCSLWIGLCVMDYLTQATFKALHILPLVTPMKSLGCLELKPHSFKYLEQQLWKVVSNVHMNCRNCSNSVIVL